MMKKFIQERKIALLAISAIAVLAGAVGVQVGAVSPSNVSVFSKWFCVSDYSYQIFADGTNYYAKNGDTCVVDYSGSSASTVIQSAINALPSVGGKIAFKPDTYNISTGTINATKPVILDGLGGAVLNRASDYTGTSKAVLNILSSNVVVRDIVIKDSIKSSATKLVISQPTTNIENIKFENVIIRDAGYQSIVISVASADPITIKNVILDGVVVDTTFNSGAGVVFGKGVSDVTVRNTRIIETGHTALDIWGCEGYVRVHDTFINKTSNINGNGIAITNYRDNDVASGHCKEISITDSQFHGAMQFDNIIVHGEAEKVVIQRNFLTNPVGRDGVKITFHDLTPDRFAREVFVKDNIIANSDDNGISIVSSGTIPFQAFEISGNYIREVRANGIDLTSTVRNAIISNNMIYNTGLDGTANRAGIHLRITNNSTVFGNQVFLNNSATWSIYEENSSNNNVIYGNWVNKPISSIGAATQIFRNEGYKTENTLQSGTFSITSTGIRTVTTAHGLGYTPAAEDCSAVVLEVTNVDDWAYGWIKQDGIDGTNVTFKINVTSASGTGGATARLGITCIRA